jgi:hypothetical protein
VQAPSLALRRVLLYTAAVKYLSFGLLLAGASAILCVAMQGQARAGSVGGMVVNSANEPLAGVGVSLVLSGSNPVSESTTTGSGRFLFSSLAPGRYQVRLTKAGYQRLSRYLPYVLVVVADEAPITNLRLQMAADASIAGKLVDSDNNPVRGAGIGLMQKTYSPSGVPWVTSATPAQVVTGLDGSYRLTGIQPGEYYLVARPRPEGIPFVTSFYPGVAKPENAVAITILAGTDGQNFDFSLVHDAVYTIRITAPRPSLSNGALSPTATPRFSLRSSNRSTPATPLSETTNFLAAGRDVYVSPPVPVGSYLLDVIWPQRQARLSIDIKDESVDLGTVIPKEPNLTIFGTIRGVSISGRAPFTLDNIEPTFGAVAVGPVAQDSFRIERVPEGRYTIAPSPLPQRGSGQRVFVSSARLGGREVLGEVLELNEDSPGSLEITLSADFGRVQETLWNSRGERSAFGTVVLAPPRRLRGNPHLFVAARADHAGAFTIEDVPVGEYDVFSWQEIEPNAYLSDEFMRRFEGRGSRLRVGTATSEALRLRVIEDDPR